MARWCRRRCRRTRAHAAVTRDPHEPRLEFFHSHLGNMRRCGWTRACLLIADSVVDDDGGQGDAAEIGQCVLVVASSDAAPLLEPVEAAFDGVAVAIELGVEGWWAPAVGAAGLAVADLVGRLRDDDRDLRRAQPLAVGPGGVGLVPEDRVRSGSGAPGPDPWDPEPVEQGGQDRGVRLPAPRSPPPPAGDRGRRPGHGSCWSTHRGTARCHGQPARRAETCSSGEPPAHRSLIDTFSRVVFVAC